MTENESRDTAKFVNEWMADYDEAAVDGKPADDPVPHWLDMLDEVWREQVKHDGRFTQDEVEFVVDLAIESANDKWKPREKDLKRLEGLWTLINEPTR